MLSGVNRGSPWALSHAEGASNLLESALGSYSSAFLHGWHLPNGFDAGSAALHVAREPDVWTDGSMVEDKVSGTSSAVSGVTPEDVDVWPYSVSLLVKMLAFLGTLHWPAGSVEFGVGGISFVELLILYEQWAGERLCLEAAIPKSRRIGRPISVSAVPFGPGIDIWRSCRFWGAIFRALRLLPGGLGRFLPGGIGANHCRLRHIGWSKSCHGLTSRPRETSSVGFLDELLVLFGYSAASGSDLLAGTLPLRYFSESFARKVPTWRLPVRGSIASFLASGRLVRGGPCALSAALGGAGVRLASESGGGVKRVRLFRKTPAYLARQGVSVIQVRSRVWKA